MKPAGFREGMARFFSLVPTYKCCVVLRSMEFCGPLPSLLGLASLLGFISLGRDNLPVWKLKSEKYRLSSDVCIPSLKGRFVSSLLSCPSPSTEGDTLFSVQSIGFLQPLIGAIVV